MDSNQTRLQLLLGRADWARCTTLDDQKVLPDAGDSTSLFTWDPARSELTLATRINLFRSSPGNRVPTIDQRRGAAADCFGNVYWIGDSQTEILIRSSGTYSYDHFWSSTDEVQRHSGSPGGFVDCQPQLPPVPLAFSGLAISHEQYLVVGAIAPTGLVIFDLLRGGPPRRVLWLSSVAFSPFEFAAATDNGVWILDRDNGRLWHLDRALTVVRGNRSEVDLSSESANIFGPLDPGRQTSPRPPTLPTSISLESAAPLQQIDAISITVLPDNSVLLLENQPNRKFSLIHRLRDGVEVGNPVSLDVVRALLEPEDQDQFQLLAFDFVFIENERTPNGVRYNTLYAVGQNGDQAWGFTVDYGTDQLSLIPLPDYYPMRQFGGVGLIAGTSQVFYDSQLDWVPLVVQRRPRFVEEATLLTFVMDGKQPDCVWDRLMLDAVIPGETQVTIYSRAGNDQQLLPAQSWTQEPAPYKRGNGTEIPWTKEAIGEATWEVLFQSAVGQYLQLKLEIRGSRQLTPRLRALRAYYPRFSYLEHYLPGLYREDQQSASFLDRLLSNFAGFYTSIEDRIATVQTLFDATSAPSEALDWLGNWFGVALDPSWSESKRRLFINNAATFFEARGTVPGLMMALRLTVEDCADQTIFTMPVSQRGVRLIEKYQKRLLPFGLKQTPTAELTIASAAQGTIWTPDLGPDELNRRYAPVQSPPASYPIYLANTDPNYKPWSAFSIANLGLIPGRPDNSPELWATFLSGRYRTVADLNHVYGTTYSDFGQVAFPSQLPRRSQPLWDWYQFQGILLIDSVAHQFTVFLPLLPADSQNVAAQRSKLELVQRVIELERPAHTTYDIKFYWAFFRLGDARLGQDSLLDSGSRAPQLMLPALIGDTYLGSSYVSRRPQPRLLFQQGGC